MSLRPSWGFAAAVQAVGVVGAWLAYTRLPVREAGAEYLAIAAGVAVLFTIIIVIFTETLDQDPSG
jgi:hypothetical protein